MKQQAAKAAAPVVDNALVEELRSQIRILQQQLESRPSGENGYSAEQVNSEIEKAIKAELEVIRVKHKAEIEKLKAERDDLKKKLKRAQSEKQETITWANETEEKLKSQDHELISLREKLKHKEEMIQQLKETTAKEVVLPEAELRDAIAKAAAKAVAAARGEVVSEPDRPKMEEVFVDPLEEGAGGGIDSTNVKIEDVSISDKELMQAKVDKLKNIMGKLPMKRPV